MAGELAEILSSRRMLKKSLALEEPDLSDV